MSKTDKGKTISVYYDRDARLKGKVKTLCTEAQILVNADQVEKAKDKAVDLACLRKHLRAIKDGKP